jgi:hypothetical protein
MPRIEPTAEQLQAAWRFRKRDDWPATFEEAMAHPTLSRIVRMFACNAALMQTVHQRPAVVAPAAPPPLATQPAPPLVTRPWHPPAPSQEPLFDRKRAASGEREDD